MKRLFSLYLLILLGACASLENVDHPSGLEVSEEGPDKETALTKQNLLHLAQVYDLTPFLYTKKVVICAEPKPTARTVLVLGTEEAAAPKRLLATFLEQELDWWLRTQLPSTARALKELQKVFPNVPKAQARGAHRELLLNYLKLRALEYYLGHSEARTLMVELSKKTKPPRWATAQVLRKHTSVGSIAERAGLVPPVLR